MLKRSKAMVKKKNGNGKRTMKSKGGMNNKRVMKSKGGMVKGPYS